MVRREARPWVASGVLHGVALLTAGIFLLPSVLRPPAVVEMQLVVTGGPPAESSPQASVQPWSPAQVPLASRSAPSVPDWRSVASSEPTPRSVPPVTSSLSELLPSPESDSTPKPEPAPALGWSHSSGTGYTPPPLPPPTLAPPQGASWNLVIEVPGAGGYATAVEGLDSGHPDLDGWLSEYLRTVSFPSSMDGKPYRLHWSLRLRSERPQ